MENVIALLKELVAAKFYGEVTIQMQNGCINLVRKMETLKAPFVDEPPEQLRGKTNVSHCK